MAVELIEHKSAPTAGVFDFTGLNPAAYRRLYLVLNDLVIATDGARVILEVGIGGALLTSGYRAATRGLSSSGSNADSTLTSAVRVCAVDGTTTWALGNAAGEVGMASIRIRNPNSGQFKMVHVDAAWVAPSGAVVRGIHGAAQSSTGAIDRIRVSGTASLSSGSATLYGVKVTTDADPVWEVIEHKSAPASDTFEFTGLDLSAYRRVVLLGDGITVDDDGVNLGLQLYTGGVLRTTGYRYRERLLSDSGSDNNPAENTPGTGASGALLLSTAAGTWGTGNAATEHAMFRADLSCLGAANYKVWTSQGVNLVPTGAAVYHHGAGLLERTEAVTGLLVTRTAGGRVLSGRCTLYGLAIA